MWISRILGYYSIFLYDDTILILISYSTVME